MVVRANTATMQLQGNCLRTGTQIVDGKLMAARKSHICPSESISVLDVWKNKGYIARP